MTFYRQILLFGGNQNNVVDSINNAKQLLSKQIGNPIAQSAFYESAPWGFEASQNFINQVVEFHSSIEPIDLLNFTQSIEKELGRKEKAGTNYESRPIDIDILFIDDFQINSERLTVPHPKLHERRFTLLPLMDHWSSMNHPTLHKTIEQLEAVCTDEGMVTKM